MTAEKQLLIITLCNKKTKRRKKKLFHLIADFGFFLSFAIVFPVFVFSSLSFNLIHSGVRHSTYRDARGVAHSYFFSWEHGPTRNLEVDWLDARNICRRHCMDAVSLETPQENEFIKQRLARGNVRYIWTSGRKCNFAGCDRPDLQPPNENGWFWSGSGAKIGKEFL